MSDFVGGPGDCVPAPEPEGYDDTLQHGKVGCDCHTVLLDPMLRCRG